MVIEMSVSVSVEISSAKNLPSIMSNFFVISLHINSSFKIVLVVS